MGEWLLFYTRDLIADDLLEIGDGYRAKNSEMGASGLPFIRAGDVDGRVNTVDTDILSVECLAKVGPKRSQPGDVVITTKGTVGRVALVCDGDPEFVYSPQLCYWRSKDRGTIDPRWLFYALQSAEIKHQMGWSAGQTDMAPYISLTDQRNAFYLTIPPVSQQKAVAALLGALDDKIELNRRMNETLEAMARAIFKDWFVDFGPTRAKAARRGHPTDPKFDRPPYLAPHIWDLFPDTLDDEDKPVGWEMKPLAACLDRLKVGKLYDQKSVEPAGRVPVLDQGKLGIIGFHNQDANINASSKRRVSTFANHTCVQRLIDFDFSTIQNVIPFIGHELPTEWVHYASLGKQEFEEYRGHWPSFVIHEVTVPSPALANLFTEHIHLLLQKASANRAEEKSLAQTRDLLLPKLMSGEIRLSDAEKAVEAVA